MLINDDFVPPLGNCLFLPSRDAASSLFTAGERLAKVTEKLGDVVVVLPEIVDGRKWAYVSIYLCF